MDDELEELGDVEIIYSDGEDDEDLPLEEMEEVSAEEGAEVIINDISKSTFSKHKKSVFCCDLSKNGQLAVTGAEDDMAYVWKVDTLDVVLECTGHKDSVTEVCFNHDDQYVATGDMLGLIQVWSIKELKLIWCYEGDDLEWLVWHPSVNVLVAGSQSGDIYIWKIPQGDCKILPSHGSASMCGNILPNGKEILTGYNDGQIKLWDIKTTNTIWQLSSPLKSVISSISLNSDGSLAAVAPTSQVLKVSDGKILATLLTNNDEENSDIEAVLISTELGVLVTGSLSGYLCVWETGKQVLRHEARIECSVTVMKWGNDGKVLIGATDGAVYVCDVKSGTLLHTLTGHKESILSIALSTDCKTILTTSDDSVAKIFEITS